LFRAKSLPGNRGDFDFELGSDLRNIGALDNMTILGLDIGGANIKAANATGRSLSRPFAIWNHRDRLGDEIASVLKEFPDTDEIALTMTAELADCFSTKHEGVCFILDVVESSVRSVFPDREINGSPGANTRRFDIRLWSTEGRFVRPREARDFIRKVAAANWHALATWCGTLIPVGSALLVDIGTTTTDIIPLVDGRATPIGLTDVARLQTGELSYSGVWRTPLCAVAHSVPFRDGYCSLAAELFATSLDVYLLLGLIPEDEQNLDTANGKPATKDAAHDRVARMLCCDRHEISFDEAVEVARFLADVQRQRLAGSLERVAHQLPGPCQTVILSGSGSFLARQLIDFNRHTMNSEVISLAERFSPEVAEAACAYAMTQLRSHARFAE
jgi:probable H4MPT-linked C1 transfer pathway protein